MKDREWAFPEIEAFEKLDSQINYPDKSILFIGSSSIRLWTTLKDDMVPYNVIQRGYGGAHFRDIIYFTERILADHNLKMLVCFIANDISGSPDDEGNEADSCFKGLGQQVPERRGCLEVGAGAVLGS